MAATPRSAPRDVDRIDRVVDELDVRRVIELYCRGVDRGDADLIASVYHDDGIDEHGALFRGRGRDFAPFIVAHYAATTAATMHYVVNSLVDVTGDVASAETYFLVAHRPLRQDHGVELAGGRYLDRFERRAGTWAIAHRQTSLEWDVRLDGLPRCFPEGAFPSGIRPQEVRS